MKSLALKRTWFPDGIAFRLRFGSARVAPQTSARSGTVSYDAVDARQRFSRDDIVPTPFAGGMHWEGREGLNLSWELDFQGRQASLLRQARSATLAADLDLVSARLTLEGAVAQAYADLDRDFALADIAESSNAQRTRILDITRRRVQAGLEKLVVIRSILKKAART